MVNIWKVLLIVALIVAIAQVSVWGGTGYIETPQHNIETSETVCQYAQSAEATDELPGYEAIYATGSPNSDGNCSTSPVLKTSWEKTAWNSPSEIVLTFASEVYPDVLTVYGDYDLCIDRVWFWRDNRWFLVQAGSIDKGIGADCRIDYNYSDMNFKTNKVKLETCDWSMAAIDAVKICGSSESYPKISIISPVQDKIVDSAEKSIMLKISTDIPSRCQFSYEKDFTFGDGTSLSTTDGITHIDTLNTADSVNLYYKCANKGKANPYSKMHRIRIGEINSPSIDICNWQNCSEGAASISIDDGYHPALGRVEATCKKELEKNGFRGTYFLAYTDKYSPSDWNIWKNAYAHGHEIGGHSLSHICAESNPLSKYFLIGETAQNLADIRQNIGIPAQELTTYAWPCGNYFPQYDEWLSPYYLFARGYHINEIESKNPENMYDIRSIDGASASYSPPDLFLMADVAENYQDWVNYVYHKTCNNLEIFDYLKTKNLWVDTIGTVSKYIKERQAVAIQNIMTTSTGMRFDVVNDLNTTVFNKDLSIKIYLGNGNISNIKVNGVGVDFTRYFIDGQPYAMFNVPPNKRNIIEISGFGFGNINRACGNCNNEIKAYVVPYVGDIDGSIDPDWFYAYDKLQKWHAENNISVGFSTYPRTMNSREFNNILANMSLCKVCEVILKGEGLPGKDLSDMSHEEVKSLLLSDKEIYLKKMQETYSANNITENVTVPRTYNQLYGRFTETIRSAISEIGFNFYLEQYVSEKGYVNSIPDFDITQYSVSFTKTGRAGYSEEFKDPDQIVSEVLEYKNDHMLYVNGIKVIPLLVHQQDFRISDESSEMDEDKWDTYTKTLLALKNDSRVRLVMPQRVYELRHS